MADRDYAEFHLAPSTRRTVVTTTTTETVHFEPIRVPRPRAVRVRRSSHAGGSDDATAEIEEYARRSTRALELDPRRYPLSQVEWPEALSRFRLSTGQAQGTYTHDSSSSSPEASSSDVKGKAVLRGHGAPIESPSELAADSRAAQGRIGLHGRPMAGLPSPAPGPPPRKRRRPASLHRPRSMHPTTPGGPPLSSQGVLPSPNISPPASVAGSDDEDDAAPSRGHVPPVDLGGSQALGTLMTLPNLVETFADLPQDVQSYVLFSLLQRAPVPVLQTVNNIVAPSFRRDFLRDLPAELSVQVLGYLDRQSLCRATSVCKGWHQLIDGEWRVWKGQLEREGLWIGNGSEEQEIQEINGGPTRAAQFLHRWEEGVWDPDFNLHSPPAEADATPGPGRPSLHRMTTDPNLHVATPMAATSSEGTPLSREHYYKTIFRRRFMLRQRWAKAEPERVQFATQTNNVVTCLQFDEDKVITASDDHSINVFSTRTGELVKTLVGHQGGVWALQYVGNTLISGSTDRTVRVWDLERGVCTHVFVGHTSTVRCLQIVEPVNVNPDPNGEPVWEPPYPLIATGSRDWSLRVWKLPSPFRDAEYHPAMPMSPTEESADPTNNPFHLHLLSGHRHAVRALAAHGRTLVSGSYDCQVRVWDMMTGQCRHRLTGHTQKVYSVVYDAVRERCASGSMDGTIKLWSTRTGEMLATLNGHRSLVGLLGLSDRHLVSAAADSTLRVWNAEKGECEHALEAHSGAITCFQHDNVKVISGSDGALKMWDIQTGTFTRDLMTGINGVWQVGFDARFCVAAVQRNDRSEFEILDFGPPQLYAPALAVASGATSPAALAMSRGAADLEQSLRTAAGESSSVGPAGVMLGSTAASPSVQRRTMRRTGSLRNLQQQANASTSITVIDVPDDDGDEGEDPEDGEEHEEQETAGGEATDRMEEED